MIDRLRTRLTYANIVATLALVVALGTGTTWAAKAVLDGRSLKNGSVGSAKIAANAITTLKVKNGSLLANDFKRGQLPAGPAGPAGERGPAGAPDTTQFYDRAASDARFVAKDSQMVHISGAGTPTENGAALLEKLGALPSPVDGDHPRLVTLGPGVYDIGARTLQLRDSISIAGTSSESSIIRGSASTLVSSATTELSDLTVQHDISSSGTYTTIQVSGSAHLRFTRAALITSAAGGGNRTGVSVNGPSNAFTMRDASINVRGGVNDTGIANTNGTITSTYSSVSITGSGVSTAITTQTGGGAVIYGSRIRAYSGATKVAIGAGATGSVIQMGASDILGTLAPTHTYYCGGSYDASTYAALPANCGV